MIKKLLKLFTPQGESANNDLPQTEQSKKKNSVDNIVDFRYGLIDKIVEYLNFSYGQSEFTSTIILWVSDQRYKLIVKDKKFEGDLRSKLSDAQLNAISNASFEFKDSEPPSNKSLEELVDGVFIEIITQKETVKEVCSKAKISIANKQGSLVKNSFTIDGKRQEIFNIGRGNGENGHINHIVIRNDDELQKENNNYVSHNQAKIIFINNGGFYLQALRGGARNSGGKSATKIIRDNEVISIEDILIKTLLKDGDYIELGKKVLLKFQLIKEVESISNTE